MDFLTNCWFELFANCWFWIFRQWLGCKEKSAAQGRVQELCQVKEHQFVFESGGADTSFVFVLFVFVFVFESGVIDIFCDSQNF